MPKISLMPVVGMNTVQEDAALHRTGEEPRLYVRDAVNVDITPAGKPEMREGVRHVSNEPLANLWHSPLHGDTFATLGDQWVRVDISTWTAEPLATIGEGDISHMVLNNAVCVAGPAGIFTFNGVEAQRMAIDTPPPPMVSAEGGGSLVPGSYGLAVAWLRGGMESAPSSITHTSVADGEALQVTLPACFDPTVTHARLYLTKPDGGLLGRGEDYPIATTQVSIPLLPGAGAAPQFLHCDPMPTGRYLNYWRGRLITAKANVLRFSEAMAYHIHDVRHGFIQMPQRITFLAPVDGGIWVGQVDHVAFLQGADLNTLELVRKSARAPVPGSVIELDADAAGQYDQGGAATFAWLADNGYVVGTSGGQIIENSAGVLSGISGNSGTSVVLGERMLTVVS